MMNRVMASALLLALFASVALSPVASAQSRVQKDGISGRSVAAAALSFIIWPGLGQAVNNTRGKKVATHAIAGLVPPFRFWSAYDALVDRHGGYWKGKL